MNMRSTKQSITNAHIFLLVLSYWERQADSNRRPFRLAIQKDLLVTDYSGHLNYAVLFWCFHRFSLTLLSQNQIKLMKAYE